MTFIDRLDHCTLVIDRGQRLRRLLESDPIPQVLSFDGPANLVESGPSGAVFPFDANQDTRPMRRFVGLHVADRPSNCIRPSRKPDDHRNNRRNSRNGPSLARMDLCCNRDSGFLSC